MSTRRLVDTARTAQADIAEAVLDLEQVQQRLARLRAQLGYAVASYDSGAVTELPDGGEEPQG